MDVVYQHMYYIVFLKDNTVYNEVTDYKNISCEGLAGLY